MLGVIVIAVDRSRVVLFVYDVLSTRSLGVYLPYAILVELIRMLRCEILLSMLLPDFVIINSASLRDLVRELNVIKGGWGATFINKARRVLMVTTDGNILRRRMHN